MDNIWYIVYILSILLFFPSLILGVVSQKKTISTFDKYSKIRSICGINALDLTTILLNKANLTNVKIVKINGKLTDCYDPKTKMVHLSESTINSNSLSAIGVCAHEIGHAIQDKNGSIIFKMRNALVPIMNLFSKAFFPLMLIGSILSFTFYIPEIGIYILWASVIMYGLSFLFYLVTLPLEFDASKKALQLLNNCEFFVPEEISASKKVLDAAVWTYISALVTSMLYFLRFLSYARLFDNRR